MCDILYIARGVGNRASGFLMPTQEAPVNDQQRRTRGVTNLRQQLAWIHGCRPACKGCTVRAEMLYDQTVNREPSPA